MRVSSRTGLRWGLGIAGALVVVYCLTVLVVVATAPDIRLRWLLVDRTPDLPGVLIQQIDGIRTSGPQPEVGDRLLSIHGSEVTASVDAAWRILHRVPRFAGTVAPHSEDDSPYVDISYWSAAHQRELNTRVEVQGVPSFEIGVTLVWLVCQLGILGLGALAFWKRPFDRPVRLFFAMCIVTLGAFVGGYHWWLLSGSALLSLPFVACALLVPSVTLHFFLVYPAPKPVIARWHRATLWGLYGPPILGILGFIVVETLVWQSLGGAPARERTADTIRWLHVLKAGTYGYLIVAASYFIVTLVCLLHSVWTTQPVMERRQITSILSAGLIASLFIGYTLVLASWDRVAFALGGSRIPMFMASLVFMVAYAVGIVRYKLMLPENSATRTLILEGARLLGAIALGGLIIPLAFQAGRITDGLPGMPALAVGLVLLIVAVLATSGRDILQRQMERRLFRERFRLEKALQRIQRAVGQLADPQYLSERTLAACREVLQADWAALYLIDPSETEAFRLSGTRGEIVELPLTVSPPEGFLRAFELEGGVISSYGERRSDSSLLASGLADMPADLVHLLEIDGEPAGLLVLGPKADGGIYTGEDITFLMALTQLTGVALHCVRVHQDLTQLNEQLRVKVERIAQQRQQILLLQAELAATRPVVEIPEIPPFQHEAIKGSGAAITAVLEIARKASASDASVLIRGESGTGKELLARAIHENSPRRDGPLIAVHCAALSPALLESELFGHVKGAFTGAVGERRGRFELADGGTLFLDEIGELSPEIQVKLLRVLQQREIEPVGSATAIPVNVRLVAATHRNLEEMIADGRFREDLYYRLNVITLTTPALRDRREDLQELASEFLKRACEKSDKRLIGFEEAALDALLRYEWPGNIRELENVIERAVVLSDGELVTLDDLPADLATITLTGARTRPAKVTVSPAKSPPAKRNDSGTSTGRTKLDQSTERQVLREALARAHGNKAQAAKLLGLPRSTFFSKLRKHSIQD